MGNRFIATDSPKVVKPAGGAEKRHIPEGVERRKKALCVILQQTGVFRAQSSSIPVPAGAVVVLQLSHFVPFCRTIVSFCVIGSEGGGTGRIARGRGNFPATFCCCLPHSRRRVGVDGSATPEFGRRLYEEGDDGCSTF